MTMSSHSSQAPLVRRLGLLLCLLGAVAAAGQLPAKLRVKVVDPAGRTVDGVRIWLVTPRGSQQGPPRNTKADGTAELAWPPDVESATLQVEHLGYHSYQPVSRRSAALETVHHLQWWDKAVPEPSWSYQRLSTYRRAELDFIGQQFVRPPTAGSGSLLLVYGLASTRLRDVVIAALRPVPVERRVIWWNCDRPTGFLSAALHQLGAVPEPLRDRLVQIKRNPSADGLFNLLNALPHPYVVVVDSFDRCWSANGFAPRAAGLQELLQLLVDHQPRTKAILLSSHGLLPKALESGDVRTVQRRPIDGLPEAEAAEILRAQLPGARPLTQQKVQLLTEVARRLDGHPSALEAVQPSLPVLLQREDPERALAGWMTQVESGSDPQLWSPLENALADALQNLPSDESQLLGVLADLAQPVAPAQLVQRLAPDLVARTSFALDRLTVLRRLVRREGDRYALRSLVRLLRKRLCNRLEAATLPAGICTTADVNWQAQRCLESGVCDYRTMGAELNRAVAVSGWQAVERARLQAEFAAKRGDRPAAINHLREARLGARSLGDTQAELNLVWRLFQLNLEDQRLGEAAASLAEAEALTSAVPTDEKSWKANFAWGRGEILLAEDRPENRFGAELQFQEALQLYGDDPRNAPVKYSLGRLLFEQGDQESALARLDEAKHAYSLQQDWTGFAAAALFRSDIFLEQSDSTAALLEIAAAVHSEAVSPLASDARLKLITYQLGGFEHLRKEVDKAVAIYPPQDRRALTDKLLSGAAEQ
jgi:tetratricopeptide (TPR) repeat protein